MSTEKPPTEQDGNRAKFWKAAGWLIKQEREQRGWTQVELARRAGVSTGLIAGFELGEKRQATLEGVLRVVRAFGGSLDDFVAQVEAAAGCSFTPDIDTSRNAAGSLDSTFRITTGFGYSPYPARLDMLATEVDTLRKEVRALREVVSQLTDERTRAARTNRPDGPSATVRYRYTINRDDGSCQTFEVNADDMAKTFDVLSRVSDIVSWTIESPRKR